MVLSSCQGSAPAVAAPRWMWPVPAGHTVLRGFVAPVSDYGRGHRGIDVRAEPGTEIIAPATGRVSFAGHVVDRDVMTVTMPDDWAISFDAATASVPAGSQVNQGTVLGMVAPTPHCSCLHIGVRAHGSYVNPLLVFGEVPRAVLLPW